MAVATLESLIGSYKKHNFNIENVIFSLKRSLLFKDFKSFVIAYNICLKEVFYYDAQDSLNDVDYLYHITYRHNKESILKYGLIPMVGEDTKHFNREYFNVFDPMIFVNGHFDEDEVHSHEAIVFEIDKNKIDNVFYSDPGGVLESWFITFDPIPNDNNQIKLIYDNIL
jgi:hypothetical protein